jgi:glutaredoxin-like protein NrdH
MSKRFFDVNGVPYDAIDVTQDPTALDRIKALGYMALPVIETPDAHWAGYDPDRLASLLPAGI